MKRTSQHIAFDEAHALYAQLKQRDERKADRRRHENDTEAEDECAPGEEYELDQGGTYLGDAPKDTLHALQLLITAAGQLQEKRPVGRPRKDTTKQ